jgi:hypothetical protein
MSVVLSPLRAALPDRAPGRTRWAVVAVCLAILCGTSPLELVAAAPTTAQTDRCGHTAKQRDRIHHKARKLGASRKQARKIMKKCGRRAAIPVRVQRRRPRGRQGPGLKTTTGRDCAKQRAYGFVWRTCGGTWFEAQGYDGNMPRVASATFNVHFCWNHAKKVKKRRVWFRGWDIGRDVTSFGAHLYRWDDETSGGGYYASSDCMKNNADYDCYRTWRSARLATCPAQIGCIGDGTRPKVDVMLYTTIGAGFIELLETRPG